VRQQRVRARGDVIAADDVPDEWLRADVALIGPVFGEVDPGTAALFDRSTLVGVSAQGFLRALDDDGNVVRAAWDGAPFWRGATAVFASDEDLAGGRDDTAAWCRDVPIVAMTESRRGLQLWAEGRWRRMDAFPEAEVDPTGAGDTFATAFLIRLAETNDAAEAARFGSAAASLAVRGAGADAQPSREEIEERMRAYPEVVLR
jgi:sugar/nucleoside kinase (ribokinase family)